MSGAHLRDGNPRVNKCIIALFNGMQYTRDFLPQTISSKVVTGYDRTNSLAGDHHASFPVNICLSSVYFKLIVKDTIDVCKGHSRHILHITM